MGSFRTFKTHPTFPACREVAGARFSHRGFDALRRGMAPWFMLSDRDRELRIPGELHHVERKSGRFWMMELRMFYVSTTPTTRLLDELRDAMNEPNKEAVWQREQGA